MGCKLALLIHMGLGGLIVFVAELGILISLDQQNGKKVALLQWLLLALFVSMLVGGIFWLTVLGCCECLI